METVAIILGILGVLIAIRPLLKKIYISLEDDGRIDKEEAKAIIEEAGKLLIKEK